MASEQRNRAVLRLETALAEQDRLGKRFDAAVGTPTEPGAYVRLRTAGDQVTAREAWLNWVDDEGYRGLNAGPFELLAESRATPTHPVGQIIKVGREPATQRAGGRAWLNGREVGGADPRYTHLEASHD